MEYENFEVPVFALETGAQKLLKYGMDTFEMYADEIDMSFCDRNRVICKCIKAHGEKELRELECPKNLIGERWNFYTTKMRFNQKKAREILKRVDSQNTGFIPGLEDVEKLTEGMGDQSE